jgi:hypothetical protein
LRQQGEKSPEVVDIEYGKKLSDVAADIIDDIVFHPLPVKIFIPCTLNERFGKAALEPEMYALTCL